MNENQNKIITENLNLYYGENHALKDINMKIREGAITAFIGPSGCGKSTFLKTRSLIMSLELRIIKSTARSLFS